MGYADNCHTAHALVICAKADYDHAQCAACDAMCTGITYGCKECRFFIDHACLHLPQEVSHPSHPPHPLALDPRPRPFTCDACLAQRTGFQFVCHDAACGFAIDVRCAFPLPLINLRSHRHRLHYFDQVGPEEVEPRQCSECREPCRSSYLCCLEVNCHFAVHLRCGCFSCQLKHCCRRDRLELRASMKQEDDDFYYCYVCEEEIGAEIPVFYCKDCGYIAHEKCLMSEVKRQGMELKIIPTEAQDGEEENLDTEEKELVTFGGMVESFNDKEKSELADVCKKRVAEIIRVLAWRKNFGSFSNSNSPFLDEAFLKFRNKLQAGIKHSSSLAVASKNDRVVEMAEYEVTQKLAPVLNKVFAKYGDVSAEATISSKAKSIVFIMLCGTIDSMANTKMADVSESLLYNWWKYIILIHLSKFKIQFAIDQLKVVMRAHYNLQDRNNFAAKTDKEIVDLSEEIEVNEKKLKESKKKLDKMKKKRERAGPPVDENLREAYSKNSSAWTWETGANPKISPR